MEGYSTSSRTNKGSALGDEAGYVLGITLILLSISLLFVASFFKRQMYHEDWLKTMQQTASIGLVAEDCLAGNRDRTIECYEAILGKVWKDYEGNYGEDMGKHKEAFKILAAAQAYIQLSRSCFHTLSQDGLLYSSNLSVQRFSFRTPHLDAQTSTHVKSYNYIEGTLFLSSFSKGKLVRYDIINKKVKSIETQLEKGLSIVDMEESIQSIKSELFNKPLYELVVDVSVIKDGVGVMNEEKIYLTLKLIPNEERQVPYRLSIDTYNVNN